MLRGERQVWCLGLFYSGGTGELAGQRDFLKGHLTLAVWSGRRPTRQQVASHGETQSEDTRCVCVRVGEGNMVIQAQKHCVPLYGFLEGQNESRCKDVDGVVWQLP